MNQRGSKGEMRNGQRRSQGNARPTGEYECGEEKRTHESLHAGKLTGQLDPVKRRVASLRASSLIGCNERGPAVYSITSSARTRSVDGISSARAFAVFRLMT